MDIDLMIICLRETFPNAVSLGLKAPQYYNLTETMKIFNVFGGLTFYYVIIFFYSKMSDPNIHTTIPIIIPVISETSNIPTIPITPQTFNNEVFINIFNKTAHKLMLENNEAILDIALKEYTCLIDTMEYIKKFNYNYVYDKEKISLTFQENIIESIKENKELYANLNNNDLVVKYIGSICRQGFMENKVPQVLGFKLDEF